MKTIHLVLALLIIFLPGCQESAQTEPSPSGRRNHMESGFVEANGQKLYYANSPKPFQVRSCRFLRVALMVSSWKYLTR